MRVGGGLGLFEVWGCWGRCRQSASPITGLRCGVKTLEVRTAFRVGWVDEGNPTRRAIRRHQVYTVSIAQASTRWVSLALDPTYCTGLPRSAVRAGIIRMEGRIVPGRTSGRQHDHMTLFGSTYGCPGHISIERYEAAIPLYRQCEQVRVGDLAMPQHV